MSNDINKLFLNLPEDLQRVILSYGHPSITKYMRMVLNQLWFLRREFDFQRKYNISGHFYKCRETEFIKFVFMKTHNKSFLGSKNQKTICYNDCCRNRRRRIPFYNRRSM